MREEKTEQKYEKKQERNSIEEGESGLKNWKKTLQERVQINKKSIKILVHNQRSLHSPKDMLFI
jgi:hypothetical protein